VLTRAAGNHAGVIHARDILGSHFQSAIELVETEPRFTVFLVWAGLTSFCYGGLYGLLAMVTCLARAGTLMHQGACATCGRAPVPVTDAHGLRVAG
jgi:hypothetical protein